MPFLSANRYYALSEHRALYLSRPGYAYERAHSKSTCRREISCEFQRVGRDSRKSKTSRGIRETREKDRPALGPREKRCLSLASLTSPRYFLPVLFFTLFLMLTFFPLSPFPIIFLFLLFLSHFQDYLVVAFFAFSYAISRVFLRLSDQSTLSHF